MVSAKHALRVECSQARGGRRASQSASTTHPCRRLIYTCGVSTCSIKLAVYSTARAACAQRPQWQQQQRCATSLPATSHKSIAQDALAVANPAPTLSGRDSLSLCMYRPATFPAGAVAAISMASALLSGVRSSSGYRPFRIGATSAFMKGSALWPVCVKKPVARCVCTMPGWMATALSWP